MLVSIIIPCYNEEAALPYFMEAIQTTEAEMTAAYGCGFELLFVNDGSRDGTLSVLRWFAKETPNVRYLSFSRNFGKEAAMYAGLREARGDYVAIMDADLQHPPAMLPAMYEGLMSGEYECVAARRESRKGEPPIRSFFARCFYKLINRISDTEIVDGACDFRMMTRQMVDAIVSMGEYNRFSKGIFGWVGFRTKWLPYEGDQVVLLEAVAILSPGHRGLFYGPSGHRLGAGHSAVLRLLPDGDLYHRQDAAVWRPGQWLAVLGLHGDVYGWYPAAVHGHSGPVSGQDLSGDQAPPHLYPGGDRQGEPRCNEN